jgi:hypothetical protein
MRQASFHVRLTGLSVQEQCPGMPENDGFSVDVIRSSRASDLGQRKFSSHEPTQDNSITSLPAESRNAPVMDDGRTSPQYPERHSSKCVVRRCVMLAP